METSDKQFFLTLTAVTAALVVFAIVVIVIANALGDANDDGYVSQAQIHLADERIKPVGQVRLQGELQATSAAVAGSESAAAEINGEKVYLGACQACHAIGAAGAPIVGQIDQWAVRIAQGKDVLYQSGIQGKGAAMPAKGGNASLSDAEVKAAVDYMIDASQ